MFQQITGKAFSSLETFILAAQLGTQRLHFNAVLRSADEKKVAILE
jgi:hypothetical protein